MKRVVLTGPSSVCLGDFDEPTVAENYAKVKIITSPMCTEYHQFKRGGDGPMGGHEAAGEVVEIGPTVTKVKVGDRVVVMPGGGCGVCDLCLTGEHIYCMNPKSAGKICGGQNPTATFAQYCVQQDWLLWPVPDGVSYDHASMACCGIGPAFNGMQSMNVGAGDTVLVSGLGPVGLGAVVIALYRGARVLGIDTSPYRIDLAKRMGVEAVLDPTDEEIVKKILDLTGGKGVDKSIECSSAPTAPELVVNVTRRRGHIASPGWGGPVTFRSITAKGLTVHGCWHWNHLRDADVMANTIRGAENLLSMAITHIFPFSIQEAFDVRASNECGKILLHPWE